tara:strand:+ start:457 stop:717 length:261 start_codon:yes stop_codon:yes gene_type:complete
MKKERPIIKLDKPKQNELTLFLVVQRIFAFPFFAGLSFIGAFFMWLKWIYNFVKHGGEAVVYTHKMSRKTIHNLLQELIEKDNQEK